MLILVELLGWVNKPNSGRLELFTDGASLWALVNRLQQYNRGNYYEENLIHIGIDFSVVRTSV